MRRGSVNTIAPSRGKLVRDRIPEIIGASGAVAVIRTLDSREFEEALREKLVEEVAELSAASGDQIAGEVADVFEVIDAFCAFHRVSMDEIRSIRRAKAEERGVLDRRVYLIETRQVGAPEQPTGG